ncbi:MAG: hypothetical protein IJR84_09170 [Bacteroidaceae bacterium]|nr:hypothetical protein [Bacteroidaceae bacterium]
MQSNNGDLYFRAGIDLDGFNAGADAMERRMRDVTNSVVADGEKMEDAITRIGGAFTKIVGAGAAAGFVKQIFNVRSEMQNTEAMLRVFLGSAEKADSFFKSLQGYAYNNVFEFKDLAKQSAQLLAYKTNVEEVIPTLNKLSEIAAGTNAPLENLVTVFNKVKANNKIDSNALYSLGSMGIDVYQVLADIKSLEKGMLVTRDAVKGTTLEFKDLEKVIDHVTTNGGMFEGMMQEKMKTLGDSWGLMQDNLTNMFNEIGEQMQGWLKGGMDVANFLVEHYEEVAKVLATLAITYGTVKAANIAMSLAQKNGTGIAVMDNTARAIQGKLLQLEITSRTNVKKSIESQRSAQESEIATLRAYITEQEHAEMIDKARTSALQDILTEAQKTELAQLGINQESEEYLPIATSMLDSQQAQRLAQAELTKHNQAYIDSMRDLLGIDKDVEVSNENLVSIFDDRIAAAQDLLASSEAEANATADAVEQAKRKVEVMQDYYDQSLQNINATDLQERQEALEAATAELETAQKNAETAAETRNTAQRRLNELQTKKQSATNVKEATTTSLAAKAKLALTNAVKLTRDAFKKLWATLMANPLGLIVAGVTALVSGITWLVQRNKEAKQSQEEHNSELAKFNSEVTKETARVENLMTVISNTTKGTAAYSRSLQELNKICKEYNTTAFNAIEPLERQKQAYEELTAAIRAKVAAKILEKAQENAYSNKEGRDSSLITSTTDMMSRKQNVGKGTIRDFFKNEEYASQRDLFMTAMVGEAGVVASGMESADEAVKKLIKTFEEFTGKTISGKAKITLETMFARFVDSARQANAEMEEATRIADNHAQAETKNNEATATGTQRIKELTTELAKLKKEREDILKLDLTEAELKSRLDAKDDEIKAVSERLKLYTGSSSFTKSISDIAKKRKEYNETLKKEEAMLQYDVEDARIAAMEEGADKQLATMANSFNRQMAELEFERKEIDKKRKELGLSAINWEESDPSKMGTEQRQMQQKQNALIQSYNQQMKSVYEGEVERMRRLYEQYDKWVETLGEEAANKRFEKLLPKGEDYGAWLANAIIATEEQLNSLIDASDPKRQALLDYLYQLQDASNTLHGIESNVTRYLRELNKELDNAGTEADKLAILNREIERLSKGDPNLRLTSSQISSLLIQLRTQARDTTEGIEKTFTTKYLSFVKDRQDKIRQYRADIAKLGADTELGKALQSAMEREVGEDAKNFIKIFLNDVFGSNQTRAGIKDAYKTLERMRKAISSAISTGDTSSKDLASFGLAGLTPDDLQNLLDIIKDVKEEVEDIDPQTGLSVALKNIREGLNENDAAKLGKGIDYISDAYSRFTQVVSALSDALNDLAEASDNENLKNTANTVSKVSNVLQTAGSWAGMGASVAGGWGALVGGILGGGLGVVQEILNSNAEKEERIAQASEQGVEFQQQVATQLVSILGAVNGLSDVVTSLNYEQYRGELLKLIQELQASRDQYYEKDENGKSYWDNIYNAVRGSNLSKINENRQSLGSLDVNNIVNTAGIWQNLVAAGLISEEEAKERERQVLRGSQRENWNSEVNNFLFGWLDDLMGDERTHTYHHDADAYAELTADSVADYINWMAEQFAKRQDDLIKELESLYAENSHDSLRYFNKENEVYQNQLDNLNFQLKWLEALGLKDTDQYRELVRQIANLENEMGESLQHMAEGLFGMDMGSLIDEWISIFQEFGDNVDGAFAKIDEGIDNMIANMLLKRNVVEPLLDQITDIFTEYQKEVGDDHEYTERDFEILGRRIKDAKKDAYDGYQLYLDSLKAAGISIDSLTDSSMTGSLQNLTEETGGVIAGRLNAMVINQAEGNNFLRQSLLVQYEMRNYLGTIQADVAVIKQRVNNNTSPFNTNMNYGHTEVAQTGVY